MSTINTAISSTLHGGSKDNNEHENNKSIDVITLLN